MAEELKQAKDEILISLKDKQSGRDIKGKIIVVDEFALAFYSDKGFSKNLFIKEKASGNVNISFNERKNVITQKYPTKKREEITQYIRAMLQKAGWKQVHKS